VRRLAWFSATCLFLACSRDGDPSAPEPRTPPTPACEIQPGNVPPALSPQPDTLVAVGDTLRLTAVAADANSDAVRYNSIVSLRSRLEFPFPLAWMDAQSGRFWFVPSFRDIPSRAVWFVADDGRCGRDTTTFVIRVYSR